MQVNIKPVFVDAAYSVIYFLQYHGQVLVCSVQCNFTLQKSHTVYSEFEIFELDEEEAINVCTVTYYTPLKSTSSLYI